MSAPLRTSELQAIDHNLHELAGLAYAGNGEWIGTDKQWDKYEKMAEAEAERINDEEYNGGLWPDQF